MITEKEISCRWGGLRVTPYGEKNIDPLIPLLQIEFSNWSLNKIYSYMRLVTGRTNDMSGVLVAQNEALYNVGVAIYTFQQIGAQFLDLEESIDESEKIQNILVVENIIASSAILEKAVFMALVQGVVKVAEHFKCDYLELPSISNDKSFEFVQKKYGPYVEKTDNFRTYIRIHNSVSKDKFNGISARNS